MPRTAPRTGYRTGRRPASRPLNPARLEELALAYAARFATSAARLEHYLSRKVRERGWGEVPDPSGASEEDEDGTSPTGDEALEAARATVTAVVGRCVALGYVNDAAFARARAGGLARRGLGARRIEADLAAAGIAEDLRHELRPDGAEERRAAVLLARRRRLGPYGAVAGDEIPAHGIAVSDRTRRERQIAVLLRAGHSPALARRVVEAASVAELEDWVEEVGED